MSGSRWVTIPLWSSRSLRPFLYSSSLYSFYLFLISASVRSKWYDHLHECSLTLSNFLEVMSAAAAAKSLQSCPTLWDPIDGSPPGSSVPGILQARKLEWVAISFSNAWKWKVKVKLLSHVWLFATPWTAAYQAPPSMGFSRQEYWSRVPWPSLAAMSSLSYSIVFLYFFVLFI